MKVFVAVLLNLHNSKLLFPHLRPLSIQDDINLVEGVVSLKMYVGKIYLGKCLSISSLRYDFEP
jgi:hypothetical protein